MSEEAKQHLPVEVADHDVAQDAKAAIQIKVGSRLGVWGLVGGFGAITSFTLGAPISLGAAISAMGAGLLVSGIGTLAASTGVLRKTQSVPPIIRTAALAGIPLGGVLGLLGVTSLTLWGPLVAAVNAMTPLGGLLGALVVLLLAAGFVMNLPNEEEGQ